MGNIHVLDYQIANLIAAGEVVDRPASVIKELMENSIDSGGNAITVEIKRGGVALMRVTDNGCGMSREDVPIAIKRHATSKISSASDLDGIITLGFRGEALAAISSVSKMRILTKRSEDSVGTVLESDGGNILDIGDAGCPNGTTVIVEDLFANVPARRKFLKKDISETTAIAAVVEKIALSRPDIAVKFIVDGKMRFSTAGDSKLINAIYAVLGRDFAKKMIEVSDMTEGIEITGYIGNPENIRGTRNYQNFFINSRFTKSATATAALEQAYQSFIPSDKFPCCVLNIKIHPALVDVNVHPAKLEVKFSNEKIIFNAVYSAVRNTLAEKIKRPELEIYRKTDGSSLKQYSDIITQKCENAEEAEKISERMDRHSYTYKQIHEDFSSPAPIPVNNIDFNKIDADIEKKISISAANDQIIQYNSESIDKDLTVPPLDINREKSYDESFPGYTPNIGHAGQKQKAEQASANAANNNNQTETVLPWYRIAGVAFNCYIFVEMTDKMLVIDKHAAHERIIFEDMKKNQKAGAKNAQMLLIPLTVTLSSDEIGAVISFEDDIKSIGFDFNVSENNKVSITQIPSSIGSNEAAAMFEELAGKLKENTVTAEIQRDLIYEKALYQASCKAAVKAGKQDSPETITWICEKLLTLPDIKFCPHGRPVAFEISKSDFEKQFKRQ